MFQLGLGTGGASARARDEEIASFENFKASQAEEWSQNYGSQTKHNLKGIFEISDIKLSNNGDLKTFLSSSLVKLKLKV